MDPTQENSAERRRRQNRLNQQARRKRLAKQAKENGVAQKWIIYSASSAQERDERQNELVSRTSDKPTYFCQLLAADRNRSLQKLQNTVAHNFLRLTLDAEALTSLTRHNVTRAMMVNAAYLGLTMDLLREDIISPFNIIGPSMVGSDRLPPSLRPTALQKQIIHHPWVDLCPMPSLRDAMLRRANAYDEDELCHDLFMGAGDDNEHQVGLVVWGESWDPSAYELSEMIVKKWQWLLGECTDVMQSTNAWRAKSDRSPLRIDLITDEPIHIES